MKARFEIIKIYYLFISFFITYMVTAQCDNNTEVRLIQLKITDNFPSENFYVKTISPKDTAGDYAINVTKGVWTINLFTAAQVKDLDIDFEMKGVHFEKLDGPNPIISVNNQCIALFTYKPYWTLTIEGDQDFFMKFSDDKSEHKDVKFISRMENTTTPVEGRIYINEKNKPFAHTLGFNFKISMSEIFYGNSTFDSFEITRKALLDRKPNISNNEIANIEKIISRIGPKNLTFMLK